MMTRNFHTPVFPYSSRDWFCVRTKPKQERVAAAQLARLAGVEVFAPRIRFRRNTKRGRVWFEEALFPGYIFARFNFEMQVRLVSSTYGVRGLVRFDGECATVPEDLIETLRAERIDDAPIVIEEPSVKVGDEAVVTDGALYGLQAVVTQVLSGGERVKILMDMMGTEIEAEIAASRLEAVA